VLDGRHASFAWLERLPGARRDGLYDLKQEGFDVSVVQNPTISLGGDAAATRLVIDEQQSPVILVGHSYGGAVITEAGTDPKVTGLVYITAFAPDKGESVNTLIANPPPGAPVPPILPPKDGYLFLDKTKFAASFAGDVDARIADFMANSQVPWGLDALSGQITDPAWKTKPSWYLLVTDDRMIPLPAQRFMCERAGATATQVPGSHAIYVSNPSAVANLIETAANSPELAK
jgi:pimeloyl-ACP methyl ester carboxylesterase